MAQQNFPLDRGAPPVDVIPAPLPANQYSDPHQLQVEMKKIWATGWIFVGPRHQFPTTAGYTPITVAGQPILVTYHDEQLKAFYNVCAHRGCQLTETAAEDRNSLSCPYHAWVYGIDGNLRSARDFSGAGSNNVPPSGDKVTALTPVAIDTWLDFVFINLDSQAIPLAQSLEPITKRWKHVDFSSLEHVASLEYDFSANWKLIVENFLESYHVPFLHKDLNKYSPATGRYQVQLANNINGIGTQPYEGVSIENKSLPQWPSEENINYAEYFNASPNFLLGFMPDHLFAWSLEPDGPNRTQEVLHFYFPANSATDPQFEEHRRITLERWKNVNDEDHDIVQKMHHGLASGALKKAQLSPVMERNILRFQNHILDETQGE